MDDRCDTDVVHPADDVYAWIEQDSSIHLKAATRFGDPVAVGNALGSVPPRRSVRAELPHTAPTLGAWRRNARSDKVA
jgi:hypothetical protein